MHVKVRYLAPLFNDWYESGGGGIMYCLLSLVFTGVHIRCGVFTKVCAGDREIETAFDSFLLKGKRWKWIQFGCFVVNISHSQRVTLKKIKFLSRAV